MVKSENQILMTVAPTKEDLNGQHTTTSIPVSSASTGLEAMRERRVLTVEEVAERLKVSPATIYGILRAGEMTSYKVGRAWRVDEEDLNDYIQKQKQALMVGGFPQKATARSREDIPDAGANQTIKEQGAFISPRGRESAEQSTMLSNSKTQHNRNGESGSTRNGSNRRGLHHE